MVNGLELNVNSSLVLLKGAAEHLEHEELFLAANKLCQEEARQKGVIQVHMPRQPSQEERELHGVDASSL